MTFARVWLGLNGLVFLLYGIYCLVVPSAPAAYSGMVLPDASARTEVVAMYGGLQAGVGALLAWTALRPERITLGLTVLVVVLGSLALGRGFGLLTHGASPYNVSAILYEGTGALLGLIAWRLARPSIERPA